MPQKMWKYSRVTVQPAERGSQEKVWVALDGSREGNQYDRYKDNDSGRYIQESGDDSVRNVWFRYGVL